MNRVLKVLSIAVILFLAYMWVSILYKSCNKQENQFDTFEDSMVEEVPSLDDEYAEDPFFTNDGEIESTSEQSREDDPIDYDDLDQKIESTSSSLGTKSNSTSKPKATPVKYKSTSTNYSSGRYMVIAGSYLLEGNADEMVNKLDNLGYGGAEKVIFDLSQFHSVCAGRYTDFEDAQRVSQELKRKGIDNYVHKRKA